MNEQYCIDYPTPWPAYLLADIESLWCVGWPCTDSDGSETLYLDGASSSLDH
jgi:hypothetical protein